MQRILRIAFYCLVGAIFFACLPSLAQAIEVAPRITDREVIEQLARLHVGQSALDQRFTGFQQTMDQRFADTNQRITDFQQTMDQRLADTNQRITDLQQTMLALFGALIALIIALFGYIAWDRRTMFRPIRERLERIEEELRIEPDRPVSPARPRARRPVDAEPPDAAAHGAARA